MEAAMQFVGLSLLLRLCTFCLITSALNQEGLYLQRVKLSLSDSAGSLSSWSDHDATPCNWTGVTCTDSPTGPTVTSVMLPGASLSGPFPISLCSLPSLSSVSLSDNSVNSSLSLSIFECRNLTALDLSQNLLVGPIPYTIAHLPYLRYLNLEGNSFSGQIPASFGIFRQLETLIINGNLLNGTIPAVLGNISSLKSLELAYNPFQSSQLAPELGNLTKLENIWLAGCNLVGPIPETFGQLNRLSNFDLSSNGLTGSISSLIFQFKNVVQIELYNNSFTGDLPTGWSNLSALRRFDASMNELTGNIPEDLCELKLESLNLYQNKLEGVIPEVLAKSPYLYELKLFSNQLTGSLPDELGMNSPIRLIDVSTNQLSGEMPKSLCRNGALEELLLIYNSFSGNIPTSLGDCRSLRRIRMRNNGFSGEVPSKFWGLPHMNLLELRDNAFSGSISRMISGAKNLSTLSISKNKFSGAIPSEIVSLGNLIEFSASDNQLMGEIPGTIVHLGKLVKLDLSNNLLSGKIPSGIKSLDELNELNLSNNGLSGELPDEIGTLPALNYLDLSGNHFSGKIPLSLQSLKLSKLNLSNNRLSGNIPPLFAKEFYRDSFLGNPDLCIDLAGRCLARVGERAEAYSWMLKSIFSMAAIVFLVGVVWFWWKYQNFRKMKKKGVIISKWTSFHKLGFSEFEIIGRLDEDNLIGRGASGKVYKAVLSNGEIVAVKKLWERSDKDETSCASADSRRNGFKVEVETLGKIRHKNIVRLWCCCSTGNCKLLVYEYMPNGSLSDLLHSSKSGLLDWPTRFRIALDAAEGLSYLHHDCVPPIVHRDVKSSNILLSEDFGAKISDFGAAKIVKAVNKGGETMSTVAGSCGYIAPEYAYTLRVNEKSDIYSFGVVILELVTGRRPIDPEFGEKDLGIWVCTTLGDKGVDDVLDPHLDSNFREHICKVLDIGLLCISPLPTNRPSMRRVVQKLQELDANNSPKNKRSVGKIFS